MWLMLQQDKPEDYVISTGVTTSIRDFVTLAFKKIGVSIKFRNEGIDEEGYVFKSDGKYKLEEGLVIIKIDKVYFRPTEVDLLVGDSSKAKENLGWEPKYNLSNLISEMIDSDLNFFKKN